MKKMKHSTRARLLSILTISFVVICGICNFVVAYCNTRMEEALDEKYNLYVYSEEFRNASEYLSRELRVYAASGDEVHLDNYLTEINETKRREKNYELVEASSADNSVLEFLDAIMDISSSKLEGMENEAIALVKEGKRDEAVAILFGDEYRNYGDQISKYIDDFDKEVQTKINNEIKELSILCNIMDAITYIVIAITFIIQCFFMFFVLRKLIVPIVKIKDAMDDIANGELHKRIDLEADDTETGMTVKSFVEFQNFQQRIIEDINWLLTEMSEGNFVLTTKCEEDYRGDYRDIILSIRKINRKLSATLSEISVAAQQVDSGAGQVSSASVALSQGATEQAASVEELSATISVVSDMINGNASDAIDSFKKTTIAGDELKEANGKMNELVEAMNNITTSSDQIQKIIKTIEDIAFQTNILALNAAVEAARAGNAGKGFAVVAEEVRNLAAKSAEAANSTTLLIEETVAAIDKGNNIVNDVATKMESVSEASAIAAEISSKIADASKESADKITQITTGVEQIAAVVQTNSATAEETAAASEELSAQADVCQELVSQFNLRNDD